MLQDCGTGLRKHEVRRFRRCEATWLAFAVLGVLGVGSSNGSLIAAQLAPATAPVEQLLSFEVATIKPSKPDFEGRDWDDSPGRLSIAGYTLRQILKVAYGLKSDSQVIGGPKWIDADRFDVIAKADDAETLKMQNMNREQWVRARSLMLQSLLSDRFRLKVIRSSQNQPVYALAVTRSGSKLSPSVPEEKNHGLSVHNSAMTAIGVSMDSLANYLSSQREIADRVIVNRTGLAGEYDFKLNWTHDRGNGVPPDSAFPGLFTALREQLGLELKPDKAPVDVVVVQEAAKPEFDGFSPRGLP